MKKKILVVDDSALMRRMLCDIIDSDERFQVVDKAFDGVEALEKITTNQYDAVVLDVNMPKMSGIELLRELKNNRIAAKVVMASTDTIDGAQVVFEALELGALDFIHKPYNTMELRSQQFQKEFLHILDAATQAEPSNYAILKGSHTEKPSSHMIEVVKKHSDHLVGSKVVAIASSTGGPKALQQVIPYLPKNLNAPILIVQHMPVGFTKSFAERLDTLSEVSVKEAEEGDLLKEGCVYLARGGVHMNVVSKMGKNFIHYSDEPSREGVKPCANYMYESLSQSNFDSVICVVLTGMGADGTKGIISLDTNKKIHVIAQEQKTCAVYGMPRSIVEAGLANQIINIGQIAQEIILNVGVK